MKKTIAVLFGGCSPEYNVSLHSSSAVIKAIDKNKYDVVLVGITKQGEWFYYTGDADKIENDTWHNPQDCMPAVISPSRAEEQLLVFDKADIKKIKLDGVFPVMHGGNGEDGTVQGLIQLAGLPLIGCGILSSALCMDKDKAHKIVKLAGVAVPESVVATKQDKFEQLLKNAERLGYPLYVKPVNAGSSFGITRITQSSELEAALNLAFQFDSQVIIEKEIGGFEVGCAVIGTEDLTVGEVDEIELSKGFFDYTEKYTLKNSAIHVPARLPQDKRENIKQTAKTIYKALGCSGFARVDMFCDENGNIVFNEVNTIPGFTAHSRFPNMMKAKGLTFEEIIQKVIETAF